MVKPVNPTVVSPLLLFFQCEVTSLVTNTVVWHIGTVSKALCKSIYGDAYRNMGKKGTSISRIYVQSTGDKSLALPLWAGSSNINPPVDDWPGPPCNQHHNQDTEQLHCLKFPRTLLFVVELSS